MKKNILLISCMLSCLAFNVNSQVLSESFDAVNFPPAGWTNIQVSGSANPGTWARVTSGTNPTTTPNSGAGMAMYNSFSWSSGNAADLSTPALDFSSGTFTLHFWMYRNDGSPTNTDRVEVYANTTNASAGGTLITTINRSRNLSPTETANGWYEYSFPIPGSFNGTINHLIFKAISNFGNRIFIDDISILADNAPDAPSGITLSNSTVCAGDTAILYAQGIVGEVHWYADACSGTEIGTGDSIILNPLQTATYYAINYNNGLFSSTCAQAEVTVIQASTNTIDTAICEGGTLNFHNLVLTEAGTYYDTITNYLGCDSITTINFSFNPLPVIGISENTGILEADNLSYVSYQWYDGVNQLTGEQGTSYTPLQDGSYVLEVTDANGCINQSLPYTFVITGIRNQNYTDRLNIYPNPTKGNLTINSKSNIDELIIIGLTGNKVAQYKTIQNKTIDVSNLLNGFYTVLITENGREVWGSFIKE